MIRKYQRNGSHHGVVFIMTQDMKQFRRTSSQQDWEVLAAELRKTEDMQRTRELVMLLEEAIFFRQQELALNADEIGDRHVKDEEQALKKVLDLLLETKVKKLGFPAIKHDS